MEAEEARTVEDDRKEANESDSTLDCIEIEQLFNNQLFGRVVF